MTTQASPAVRNARAQAVETAVGTSPILEIRSGAKPANTAAADSGTLLASIALPSDWLVFDGNGAAALNAVSIEDSSANAGGTAGHFRIKNSAGTATHLQGDCGITGSGADLILVTTTIAEGQPVQILSLGWTEPNA